jgi:serine/threonine-protein kinase Chk1
LGSKYYKAPEIHEKQPYNGERVDVFALGVILFIMMTQNPPFKAANRQVDKLYYFISTDKQADFWRIHGGQLPEGEEYFSAEFRDLFEKMTRYNPEESLTIA